MIKTVLVPQAFLFTLIVLGSAFFAFVTPQDQKQGAPWDVPIKYKELKNPYEGDKSLLKYGKSLYVKQCKTCHGAKGQGDGVAAVVLKTIPGDFTSDEFKKQTPGEIYYKFVMGRNEMPNFEKKIQDDEDKWAVVMYVQTLE